MTSKAIDDLTVRLAALVIVHDGNLPAVKAKSMAKRVGFVGEMRPTPNGKARGQISSEAIRRASRHLIQEGLIRREAFHFVADSLPDLAAWLADAVDDDYQPGVGTAPHPATVERRAERRVSS